MANNRMFLVCPCGGRFMLAKNMADGWYVRDTEGYGDRLNEWLEEHVLCHPRVHGGVKLALDYENWNYP